MWTWLRVRLDRWIEARRRRQLAENDTNYEFPE